MSRLLQACWLCTSLSDCMTFWGSCDFSQKHHAYIDTNLFTTQSSNLFKMHRSHCVSLLLSAEIRALMRVPALSVLVEGQISFQGEGKTMY